jgi:hypothetical protein
MEGIETPVARSAHMAQLRSRDPHVREWRLVERWLLFVFGISVIGITILALGFAAFVVR